ncbi:BrnT family toxin [Pseudomonadota bacterium]
MGTESINKPGRKRGRLLFSAAGWITLRMGPDTLFVKGIRPRCFFLGATFAGRCLVVSYTERGDTIRVISARAMTPRERRAYED